MIAFALGAFMISLAGRAAFNAEYGSETCDGTRRPVDGANFEIGLAVEPSGAMDTSGGMSIYGYEDPTMPVPYNLHIKEWGFFDPTVTEQRLEWDWVGTKRRSRASSLCSRGRHEPLGAQGC